MSNFRNVQNNGYWEPGGIYTFEVAGTKVGLENQTGTYFNPYLGACDTSDVLDYYEGFQLICDTQSAGDSCGNVYVVGPVSGNYLFDNNDENFAGGIEVITVLEHIILEDGWWRYTVQVEETVPLGTYYLKGREFHYYTMLV
jgi:hypothetical protein